MGTYTRIPQSTFKTLQLDAGVLLKTFNPANPAEITESNILCATTGGIHISATPTFSDLGEDVDNCPTNLKELKHVDSWEVTISFTSIEVDLAMFLTALGAAETLRYEDEDSKKYAAGCAPSKQIQPNAWTELWWVGDKADGGFAAARILNAISTGGLDLQTTKAGKGQLNITITGHVSINDQDKMPLELYSIAGSTGGNSE